MFGESTSFDVEEIARQIVDCAFRVHSTLGPGLLESVYSACLTHELQSRGLRVDCELQLPIIYNGTQIDAGLRIDLLVQSCIIIEVKSVEKMVPVFKAQLLTYLKLTGHRLGFLINFNVPLIKDGIQRVVLSQP